MFNQHRIKYARSLASDTLADTSGPSSNEIVFGTNQGGERQRLVNQSEFCPDAERKIIVDQLPVFLTTGETRDIAFDSIEKSRGSVSKHDCLPGNAGLARSLGQANGRIWVKFGVGVFLPRRCVASPSVPQAPTASARPNTTRNPARPPVPAQQGQPLEQNQNRNNPEVEAGEDDVDELQDEEVEPTGKKQGTGKAYIISFPEHQRATLTTMARIARARSMANGTYDDNEEVMRAKYPDWPVEEWGARESRHFIVMDSLRMACEEHETNIPFIYRHIQCVNILITSNRTLATKSLKALVDQFFKFTIEKSERNKLLSEKLLPFNFHYKDIRNKRGPFENVLLKFACQLVAFDKLSSIGAKYSEYYEGLPPPFLAYVCALLHFVIFSYRSGKFSKEDLKVGLQTSAFRRALRFMIKTQEHKPTKLFSTRNIIFDYCMDALGPKDDIRDPSPEPEREWSPDATEAYISRYAGNSQRVRAAVHDDDDDIEMGEPEQEMEDD
ncbi:hypothetical protein FRC12_017893 [Ceratobasidium sp. 428]|nr:hypothetical protein FRC12_017893 [Ceratobasidium sp. 428]